MSESMGEPVIKRLFEELLDRLDAEGKAEVLARMAVVMPFPGPAWGFIEVPVFGSEEGEVRIPVIDFVGWQARMHQLLVVFEEEGEEELYRFYERLLQEAQQLEAQQECAVARLICGEGDDRPLWDRLAWLLQARCEKGGQECI
ncbi:hypothetical protein [Thermogemmatispora sp.]|uniref:hypothetical protein n=1 Tax=Thermogemmatispora sp. TaxID=1968838 RepID=UPI0035E45B9B